jgi:hypothetical protein
MTSIAPSDAVRLPHRATSTHLLSSAGSVVRARTIGARAGVDGVDAHAVDAGPPGRSRSSAPARRAVPLALGALIVAGGVVTFEAVASSGGELG